jgi:hypothetical protein
LTGDLKQLAREFRDAPFIVVIEAVTALDAQPTIADVLFDRRGR